MRKLIESVLKRYQDRQLNLSSEAARKLLAKEIEAVILDDLKTTGMWKRKGWMKELCVTCKKETTYDKEDHIDFRIGYINGSGQLCLECYFPKD